MKLARSYRTVAVAALLLAAMVPLSACTSVGPPAPPHTPKASPPPAAVPYAVPTAQHGELARIVYERPGSLDGVSVQVPAGGVGYNVDFGCKADTSSRQIGFELLHGTTVIVSGTGRCDGNDYSDTALLPGSPAESVHLVFTGSVSKISAAYLILAPSQPS